MGLPVQQNEVHIRVLVLSHVDGLLKQEAGAYYQFGAALNGQADGFQIGICSAFLGLVIFIGDAVLLRILLKALPCALVKGLIVYGPQIGDQGKLIAFRAPLGRGCLCSISFLCLGLFLCFRFAL